MIPTGYFIMGFPTETAEDIEMTIRFARESKLAVASFFYLNPFPGTEVAKMAGEEKVISKLFRDYSTLTVNLSAVDDETFTSSTSGHTANSISIPRAPCARSEWCPKISGLL